MSRWHASSLLMAVVVCSAVVGGCSKSGKPAPGQRTGEVTKGELVQRVTVAGTVVPKRRTVITPPYNGYIRKVFSDVGQSVKAGTPIVSLVQSLQSSEDEVFPLRAPFSGVIVQVLKAEGEYVEANREGNVMVRIDDLSRLYVDADVPEIEVVKIREGQEVVVKASAVLNKTYKGQIREISLAAKEKKDWARGNVEFPVRIEIMDKDDAVRPGMSALIDIIANKKTGVLMLPHEFVQRQSGEYFVNLLDGTKRKIQVGIQNEEVFEIVEGVKEGEKVRQVDFMALSKES